MTNFGRILEFKGDIRMKALIHVSVRPNSREEKIEKISDNEYRVCVTENAEHGKANTALIKLISKHFRVSQGSVKIKTPTSRKKIVEINI